jgi:mannose-1-phosphate guanylyltransferase/mannose-6-phosphate isomerase
MIYSIILAGGSGTRFWPLSRLLFPKQFIKIRGKSSLFQDTLKRTRKFSEEKNIFIVTNRSYFSEIKNQIKAIRIPEGNIILEPKSLNTAPAISLCAQLISSKDKDALLIVFPSDHFITGEKEFRQDILKALFFAQSNLLVTVGVKPETPHTGYGYIKTGVSLGSRAFRVKSFIEKPPINKAKRIYRRKDIYWNAGIFCWKAKIFLEEVKKYLPTLYSQIVKVNKKQDIKRVWPKINPISVDYGILEKSKKIVLVAVRYKWRDLGAWDALREILPEDKNNNILQADCFDLDSQNIMVFSKTKKLIATIGLKNLIIIDTPDAMLVCDKNRSQDVKILVEHLRRKNRKECIKMPSL